MAYTKYEVLPDEECNNPDIPTYPPELARVRMYDNKQAQMDAYANTMCPASQCFEADTKAEANKIVEDYKKKFQDKAWIEENIEPIFDVRQRLYITKTRWGVYEVLNEYQYEMKLIYG